MIGSLEAILEAGLPIPERASADVLAGLAQRYAEPHRRYHTLTHIAAMLEAGRALSLSREQVIAIWFHDAVYVPGRADNEAASAALAVAWMRGAGHDEAACGEVEAIIVATRDHIPTVASSALVIDLDLGILAADRETYARYTAAVQAEYGLDDDAWRFGRGVFLDEFLRRPVIFRSDWGRALEARARGNLARELASCT